MGVILTNLFFSLKVAGLIGGLLPVSFAWFFPGDGRYDLVVVSREPGTSGADRMGLFGLAEQLN